MSEHRPFTEELARKACDEYVSGRYQASTAEYARALNAVFPQGLAAPKPAMRTTPVTAHECRALAQAASATYCFIVIERLMGGYLSGYNFANILALKSRRAGNKSQDWADAINGTFGLAEPDPPLVTRDEIIGFFGGVHFNEAMMEAHRVRLEKIVRSKLPRSDA